MVIMLQFFFTLITIYEKHGPTCNLWVEIYEKRRELEMGPHKRSTIKYAIKRHQVDVITLLFDTPLPLLSRVPKALILSSFNLAVVVPFVYDIFLGAFRIFPNHDEVHIYFTQQLYCEFVLHMKPDYASLPSRFYGTGRYHTYHHPNS